MLSDTSQLAVPEAVTVSNGAIGAAVVGPAAPASTRGAAPHRATVPADARIEAPTGTLTPPTKAAAKAATKGAIAANRAAVKAAKKIAAVKLKTAKSKGKLRRAKIKAATKASKAAAEAAAKAATGPATVLDRLTDPKTAKRAVSVGKIVAPALAPFAIKAAVGGRSFLDERRARRLGVAVADVARFRGPTGAVGARISTITRSIEELARRKDNEPPVHRFVETSRKRLADLTAAVQASASMRRLRRIGVLRAIDGELNEINSELLTYLTVPAT